MQRVKEKEWQKMKRDWARKGDRQMSAISLRSRGVVQLDLCLDPVFEMLWLTLGEHKEETDSRKMCVTQKLCLCLTHLHILCLTMLGYASFIQYLFRTHTSKTFLPLFFADNCHLSLPQAASSHPAVKREWEGVYITILALIIRQCIIYSAWMLVNTGLIATYVISQSVYCYSYDMYSVWQYNPEAFFIISTALWWIRPPNPDLDRVSGDSNPCC